MTTEPNEFIDGNGAGTAEEPDCWRQWPLEDQVAHLAESLRQAQQEAAHNLDATQRAQAEMANFRRRTDEERIANARFSNGRLITKFLPAMEDLDLAIGHANADDPWVEGVKLIQRKLNAVLESEGVTPIEAQGVMFNPLEHEALGTEDSSDHPPGYITQTLRPGYRLHDRVIRPAQVMVARAPQDAPPRSGDPADLDNQFSINQEDDNG